MKSLLRFFPALLAVWPYGILCIGLFEEDSAGSMVFLWVYCGLTAALLLFQILYCCLHRAPARTFAFWNLTVKLCHIPFYLAAFALGVLMTMAMVVPALLFVSPAVNLLLLAVDTALMLTPRLTASARRYRARGRAGSLSGAPCCWACCTCFSYSM